MVEFKRSDTGIKLPGKAGNWTPYPVEYKRGKPKPDERDEVQLCAQAICMEEMFGAEIPEGALYYGEIRRRTVVQISLDLRAKVENYANEMHRLFEHGITPGPVYKPHCKSCSLVEICLPKQMRDIKSANNYLNTQLV